jgi:hypothetical protein
MRIVQSFRGKKSNNVEDTQWLAINTCLYGLSAILCKKHGYYIKLYCDDVFYKYIKDTGIELLYDDIDLSVNDYPMPPKHIFADIKFRVMEKQDIGTIHMDGDVFLFSPDILDNIINEDFDVLIQNRETLYNTSGTYWASSANSLCKCEIPQWAKRECKEMYNCGVICIKNEKLKKEYFDTYWKMYNEYDLKGVKEYTIPDIIFEQQYLLDLCEEYNYSVKEILPIDDFQSYAKEIGYSHLMGHAKYKHIEKVLKVIYKYDKEIYLKLKNKFYGKEIHRRNWFI